MPTTSARLGRDAIRSRPSFDVYMSSTYWLFPSPISSAIATKYASRSGSSSISASRSWRSGITLTWAIRLNGLRLRMTSTVPSQFEPAKITSVFFVAAPASVAGRAASAQAQSIAASSRRLRAGFA